jgi:hypothetical protein
MMQVCCSTDMSGPRTPGILEWSAQHQQYLEELRLLLELEPDDLDDELVELLDRLGEDDGDLAILENSDGVAIGFPTAALYYVILSRSSLIVNHVLYQ